MAGFDSICAVLCLLTRAAWSEDMPAPLSRQMVGRMVLAGALQGLVLRDTDQIEETMLGRARMLLSRAKGVYQCLEGYAEKGYEVILPQDEIWPRQLFAMGEHMPQFLFLRGNKDLLARRMVAVAGSRDIDRDTWHTSGMIGKKIADEGFAVVTGCARGVDMAAEAGALRAGGRVVLVPAMQDAAVLENKARIQALDDGRMLLICDALPDDPFSAARALMRNHTIYALGEAAIAVAPRNRIGGTWRGASDCLSMGCTPVFVPRGQRLTGEGGTALVARGAQYIDISKPLAAQLFSVSQTDLFGIYGKEGTSCR